MDHSQPFSSQHINQLYKHVGQKPLYIQILRGSEVSCRLPTKNNPNSNMQVGKRMCRVSTSLLKVIFNKTMMQCKISSIKLVINKNHYNKSLIGM